MFWVIPQGHSIPFHVQNGQGIIVGCPGAGGFIKASCKAERPCHPVLSRILVRTVTPVSVQRQRQPEERLGIQSQQPLTSLRKLSS